MIDLKNILNESQLRAVTQLDGPMLVVAGAGSGKTRVIEFRVFNLIRQKIHPGSVLLLTFTRRAAREMLSRASRHDPACKNVEGGTFHSFAYKTLKRYASALGFPSAFVVLDESDAGEAIHRCAAAMGFYGREKRFPKKDTLRTIISTSINRNLRISEVIKRDYPHFIDYLEDIETLREKYAAYKIDRNYLDYDDLLIYLRILLEDNAVRERLSARYRYIMVDEYQDTNTIQADIACLLAERNGNIMVVGDDAQSIYGFRGASHENIMDFPRRFPGCTVITLEKNYRSTQSILDVANAVLETMKHKYSKCLVSAGNIAGEKPGLMFFRDAYEEAEWVAGFVKRQLDEGVPLGNQCILFRSMYLSIPLQSELGRRNIPYETYGGIKFYETAHVKDVLAHLKLLVNSKDELAWNRALMLIARIGPKTAGTMTDEATGLASLGEILEKVLSRYTCGYPFSDGLMAFSQTLRAMYEAPNVGDKFDRVLDYYEAIMKDLYDDWHLRLNDLESLRQIAGRYASLEELLEDFAVEPPERGVWNIEPETKEEEKPLVLSTIHSAKGLEWDSVLIMGLMDGVLPITFSLDSEEELAEEQRLFYVAVTRARKSCMLTMHHEGRRGGISQFNKLSRFVDVPDIMAKLERRQPVVAQERRHSGETEAPEGQLLDKRDLLRRLKEFYK